VPLRSDGRTESAHQVSLPRPNLGERKDFAVCRIEAEPAKKPSIWIKRTDIRHAYLKVGDFWLPKENTSVSIIRLGGRATLTIEYQNYEILSADPLPETDVGGVPHLAVGGR
jgi:hypothetical protein